MKLKFLSCYFLAIRELFLNDFPVSHNIEPVDCCSNPVLEALDALGDIAHSMESVCHCRHCGEYWYRLQIDHITHENWEGVKFWYVRLTKEEAEQLLTSAHRSRPSFLAGKSGILTNGKRIEYLMGHPVSSI